MAYTQTWNAALEAVPADANNVSEGAGKIRDLKRDIRERVNKDHYFDIAGTDADHGEHEKVTLRKRASKPTAEADKGYVYTKIIAGHVELFYEDENSSEVQITSNGALLISTTSLVAKSLFDANTVLAATTDDTPAALTIAEQTLLGRITGGNITALTAAQVRTLLNVTSGVTQVALGSWAAKTIDTVYQAATDGFLIVSFTAVDEKVCRIDGYTDGSNPPTTKRCTCSAVEATSVDNISLGSFTMPVKKDDYYKATYVSVSGTGTSSYTLYWIPLS